MKNRETVQAKDRLDYLFSRVNEFSEDLELQSHWARYLCVRVSGFIETSIRSILSENVGITYTTIQRYYQNALIVVELIEDQCNS